MHALAAHHLPLAAQSFDLHLALVPVRPAREHTLERARARRARRRRSTRSSRRAARAAPRTGPGALPVADVARAAGRMAAALLAARRRAARAARVARAVGSSTRSSSIRSSTCSRPWSAPASRSTPACCTEMSAEFGARDRRAREPAARARGRAGQSGERAAAGARAVREARSCPRAARPRPASPPTPRCSRRSPRSTSSRACCSSGAALTKLKSTYLDALPAAVDPADGRVHTTFEQTGAATGRLASADPNLQNIPMRTPQGRAIRRAFVAAPGYVLVGADYSQIELRVMAHLSGDPALVEAFASGEDIHASTARRIFKLTGDVPPELRARAKVVNFGVHVRHGRAQPGAADGTRARRRRRSSSTATSPPTPASGASSTARSRRRASAAGCRRCSAAGATCPQLRGGRHGALDGRARRHQHAHPGLGGRPRQARDAERSRGLRAPGKRTTAAAGARRIAAASAPPARPMRVAKRVRARWKAATIWRCRSPFRWGRAPPGTTSTERSHARHPARPRRTPSTDGLLIVGLVGRAGSGKSTRRACARRDGRRVLDADRIGHEITDRDPEVRAALLAEYGPAVYLRRRHARTAGSWRRWSSRARRRSPRSTASCTRASCSACARASPRLAAGLQRGAWWWMPRCMLDWGFERECDAVLAVIAPEPRRSRAWSRRAAGPRPRRAGAPRKARAAIRSSRRRRRGDRERRQRGRAGRGRARAALERLRARARGARVSSARSAAPLVPSLARAARALLARLRGAPVAARRARSTPPSSSPRRSPRTIPRGASSCCARRSPRARRSRARPARSW